MSTVTAYNKTKVVVIHGPMFAGKTEELARHVRRATAIGNKALIINSDNDTRTGNSIQSHNGTILPAIKVDKLMSCVHTVSEYDVIAIDESQFFSDLIEFIEFVEPMGKTIIIAGLTADSNRKRFGFTLDAIRYADQSYHITALDMDGSAAPFTKRIGESTSQTDIGAEDKYIAVNRANYHTLSHGESERA